MRLVHEQRNEHAAQWATIVAMTDKIERGAQTRGAWVKRHEIDTGTRAVVAIAEQEHIKAHEREVKESCRANEILKLASAFFAQAELDRRLKQ